MAYRLYIGNRIYFSWSIAAYLMFHRFGLADQVKTTVFRPTKESDIAPMLADHPPAKTLPTVVTSEGAILSDSMAIAEELAARHPDTQFWPSDPLARGTARALANEMHSSFGSLRSDWPVNLRRSYEPVTPPAPIEAELDRLEAIWTHARAVTKPDGPWLCGDYCLVDAVFAPMATRLATYGFDTRPTTRAYVAAHLADPCLRRWRAMGMANEPVMGFMERDYPQRSWPGPARLEAVAVEAGPSENTACPYSGLDVTHFLELDGRIYGFCNAFCRDKTVADPEAWPAFMALVAR